MYFTRMLIPVHHYKVTVIPLMHLNEKNYMNFCCLKAVFINVLQVTGFIFLINI